MDKKPNDPVVRGIKALLFAVIFVLGCAAPTVKPYFDEADASRIYNGLSQEDQRLVDEGLVRIGWTDELVLLSLGEPSVTRTEGVVGETEHWQYHKTGRDKVLIFRVIDPSKKELKNRVLKESKSGGGVLKEGESYEMYKSRTTSPTAGN